MNRTCAVVAGIVVVLMMTVLVDDTCAEEPFGPVYRTHQLPKKIIANGWDTPLSDQLPEVAPAMEQTPLDGARIYVNTLSTEANYLQQAWSARPMKQSALDRAREHMLKAAFNRMHDNFIGVGSGRASIDWFDDQDWEVLIDNMTRMAALAKETGMKGFILDTESYRRDTYQFGYPKDTTRSFDEYKTKTRQRGRELMTAIGKVYPDITILCYRFLSYSTSQFNMDDPDIFLANSTYGLKPAFFNGLLDALPPQAILVDGNENTYLTNSTQGFLLAYNELRIAALSQVAPENRSTYRSQVQVGLALYLDAYTHEPGSRWRVDDFGQPMVERFRQNLTNALSITDQYVWFWGEKNHWFADCYSHDQARKKRTGKSWEQALPGITKAIAWARDPDGQAAAWLSQLAESGSKLPDNRLSNGTFDKGPDTSAQKHEKAADDWDTKGLPARWNSWQKDSSHGTFSWLADEDGKGGTAQAAGVSHGCFIQQIRVTPGEQLIIAADSRGPDTLSATLVARWKTPDNHWMSSSNDVSALFSRDSGRKGWKRAVCVTTVPERAGYLTLLLNTYNGDSPDDVVLFDNAVIYTLTSDLLWK